MALENLNELSTDESSGNRRSRCSKNCWWCCICHTHKIYEEKEEASKARRKEKLSGKPNFSWWKEKDFQKKSLWTNGNTYIYIHISIYTICHPIGWLDDLVEWPTLHTHRNTSHQRWEFCSDLYVYPVEFCSPIDSPDE